jgi:hypothetical protein
LNAGEKMKLVNPYHWLYAKMYLLKYRSGTANIHYAVIFGMLSMIGINLIVIVSLIDTFFDIKIYKVIPNLSVNNAFLGLLLWTAANFFYFFYKGRNKKILLEFDVESKLKKPYCYMPGLIYIALTFLSVLLILPLRSIYGPH